MPDFENDARRANGRTRLDTRGGGPPATIAGFEDDEGKPRPIIGDDEVPYTGPTGRASTDPTATDPPGIPAVETGQNQRFLTDKYGRLVVITAVAPSGELPLDVSLIPQVANAGVLIVSAVPAELFDGWVGDFQQVEQRYLLAFDRVDAPTPGAVPAIAAIPVLDFMDYDFSTSAGPRAFTVGIVLALSTTPNQYTAIASADDFAITARYKVL